jgi:hypothetical protein
VGVDTTRRTVAVGNSPTCEKEDMLKRVLVLDGRCFKGKESVQTGRIIWKGPAVGRAGNAS